MITTLDYRLVSIARFAVVNWSTTENIVRPGKSFLLNNSHRRTPDCLPTGEPMFHKEPATTNSLGLDMKLTKPVYHVSII